MCIKLNEQTNKYLFKIITIYKLKSRYNAKNEKPFKNSVYLTY